MDASLIAAISMQAGLAIGHVNGSNTFTILGLLGITSLVASLPPDPQIIDVHNPVMIAVSLLLLPFVVARRDMGRTTGRAVAGLCAAPAVWLDMTDSTGQA